MVSRRKEAFIVSGLTIVVALTLVRFGVEVAIAVVGVAISSVLAYAAPIKPVIAVSFCLLSLVYVQAVLAGKDVSTVPIVTRSLRDALLVGLAAILWLRTAGRLRPSPLRLQLVGLAAVTCVLVMSRTGFPQTVSTIRYFALVPLLGALGTRALIVELGPRNATIWFARLVVSIAGVSAMVGLLQSVRVMNAGPYEGYVQYGLARSTGIVGQPNNQAFLLLVGLIALRYGAGLTRSFVAVLTLALSSATLLTFSRTGILAIAIVLMTPAVTRRFGTLHVARRPLTLVVAAGVLVSIPFLVGLRGSTGTSITDDERIELISRTIDDLGPSGLLLGKPGLRDSSSLPQPQRWDALNYGVAGQDSTYVTDNVYSDVVLIGGLGLLVLWVLFFFHVWHASSTGVVPLLGKAAIMLLGGFGLTTSAFGLFPGILLLWTILSLAAAPPNTPQRLPQQRQVSPNDAMIAY